jgi:hypothetical protein
MECGNHVYPLSNSKPREMSFSFSVFGGFFHLPPRNHRCDEARKNRRFPDISQESLVCFRPFDLSNHHHSDLTVLGEKTRCCIRAETCDLPNGNWQRPRSSEVSRVIFTMSHVVMFRSVSREMPRHQDRYIPGNLVGQAPKRAETRNNLKF